MVFSLLAWLVCAGLCFVSFRFSRDTGDAALVERVCVELRRERPLPARALSSAEQELYDLVSSIDLAKSRAFAVAAINEFTKDVESHRAHAGQVTKTMGRVCFSVGLLLMLLGLAQALSAAEGRIDPGDLLHPLLSFVAGVAGGSVCYQIGHKASIRRAAYRAQAKGLIKLLGRRLPPEAP